jgi:hypothetical protein
MHSPKDSQGRQPVVNMFLCNISKPCPAWEKLKAHSSSLLLLISVGTCAANRTQPSCNLSPRNEMCQPSFTYATTTSRTVSSSEFSQRSERQNQHGNQNEGSNRLKGHHLVDFSSRLLSSCTGNQNETRHRDAARSHAMKETRSRQLLST